MELSDRDHMNLRYEKHIQSLIKPSKSNRYSSVIFR